MTTLLLIIGAIVGGLSAFILACVAVIVFFVLLDLLRYDT